MDKAAHIPNSFTLPALLQVTAIDDYHQLLLDPKRSSTTMHVDLKRLVDTNCADAEVSTTKLTQLVPRPR